MKWRWFWFAIVLGSVFYRIRSWSRIVRIPLTPELDLATIVGLWVCGAFLALFLLGKIGLLSLLWESTKDIGGRIILWIDRAEKA